MNHPLSQNVWPSLDEADNRLSAELLDHDGLMTPVLVRHFGEVYAEEIQARETQEHYIRISSIRQKVSGILLLNATLTIVKFILPDALIESLSSTKIPFGRLLDEHGVKTTIQNRILLACRDQQEAGLALRWGRRHAIVRADNKVPLCHVQELLVPEPDLLSAQEHYL